MSQDTRKDKRAKVVSLNVRYKSATVDEFIENHSHDVSRGGLFVKTPTPFPPGTLLKFEIRLAGDKSVISGVGRVVWKREPPQAAAERPAGMGVKFIKIDDQSRAVIDKLISQKADAGSAYTSEPAAKDSEHPSTLRGLVAATPLETGPAPGPSPVNVPAPTASGSGTKLPMPGAPASTPTGMLPRGKAAAPPPTKTASLPAQAPPSKPPAAPSAPPKPLAAPPPRPSAPVPSTSEPGTAPKPLSGPPRPQLPPRKATMIGVGVPVVPPAAISEPKAAEPSKPEVSKPAESKPEVSKPFEPPRPAAAAPAAAEPAQTPSKHELPPNEPMFPHLGSDSGMGPINEPTMMKQAAELLEEALREAGGSPDEIGHNPLFSGLDQSTGLGSAGDKPPDPLPRAQSGGTLLMPQAVSPTPAPAKPKPSTPPPSTAVSARPSAPAVDANPSKALDLPKKKSGSGGVIFALLLLLAIGGGGFYAYSTGLLAGVLGTPPGPTAKPSPPEVPTTPSAVLSAVPLTASSDASAAMMGDADTLTALTTGTDAAAARDGQADAASADSGRSDAGQEAGARAAPIRRYIPPPPRPPVTNTADPPDPPTPTPTPTPTSKPDPE